MRFEIGITWPRSPTILATPAQIRRASDVLCRGPRTRIASSGNIIALCGSDPVCGQTVHCRLRVWRIHKRLLREFGEAMFLRQGMRIGGKKWTITHAFSSKRPPIAAW